MRWHDRVWGPVEEYPSDEEVCRLIRDVPAHFAATGPVSTGCVKVTKVLNATGQEVTIWCAGEVHAGINIFSVVGTNTFTFEGSLDGINYFPISLAPYPQTLGGAAPGGWYGNLANGVLTTTGAAGQFELLVGNLKLLRVQLTAGNGPAKVILTGSLDGAYQEAFQTPTNLGISSSVVYPSTTSTASDTNTLTIPPVPNATINLTFLEVSLTGGGFGGNAQLRIWDGAVGNGVPLFNDFLTSPVGSVGTVQKINLPTDAFGNIGIQSTPGNGLVVQIRNLGNTSSIINSRVSFM